jgi:hypothetical protein
MSYKVSSSEQTRKKASDTETKALLYLMNFHPDSEQINYFVIDFFNDVTGMDTHCNKLWDIQSKGINSTAKALGKELVTLYKNYCSSLHFQTYILFVSGVGKKVRINNFLNDFSIDNITDTSLTSLKDGLIEECYKRSYINHKDISQPKIDKFLKYVHFVICDKEPAEYIDKIIKLNTSVLKDTNILNIIFNEIRDRQSSKKNSKVEGITIATPDDALYYSRHLTAHEIKLMVLTRIISSYLTASNITPLFFLPIISKFTDENRKDELNTCRNEIYSMLYDNNNAQHYWAFLEAIYYNIGLLDLENINETTIINELYNNIDKNIISKCHHLTILSAKYFISLVLEGFINDN